MRLIHPKSFNKNQNPLFIMSSQKMFVRDATGLVRALGFLDQFIISQAIINILGGFVLTALFAPFYFPGANLSVVFALGSVPALAMAFVYSKLSAAIPRSGGDYIWSTRILGPFFGSIQFIFLFVGTVIIGIGLSIWSAQAVALSQLAFAIGVTTNNPGMINVGTALGQASLGYPVSVVMTVVVTVIALLGLRVYSWFQKISYFLYYIIAALFLFVLITVDPATIPALFDHAMQVAGYQVTYNGMLQQAASQGFAGTDFNLTNSLLAAIPWGFLTFTGFNYGAYLAGETKSVKNSMTRALFLSVFVTIIALVVMGLLVYRDFGSAFLNAASYIAATNPGSLPALPTTTMLLSVASPIYASLLSLGLYLGWLVVSVAYVVTMSRMLFAGCLRSSSAGQIRRCQRQISLSRMGDYFHWLHSLRVLDHLLEFRMGSYMAEHITRSANWVSSAARGNTSISIPETRLVQADRRYNG